MWEFKCRKASWKNSHNYYCIKIWVPVNQKLLKTRNRGIILCMLEEKWIYIAGWLSLLIIFITICASYAQSIEKLKKEIKSHEINKMRLEMKLEKSNQEIDLLQKVINEKDAELKKVKRINASTNSDVYHQVGRIIDEYNQSHTPVTKNHLLAIIKIESKFNPKAYNRRSGASGLCQFLPSTYRAMIKKYGIKDNGIFDVESNTLAGIHYWDELMVRNNNNVDRALSGYLGAYNARYIALVRSNMVVD